MIIGISGKAGAGKDRFAQELINLDNNYTVVKFADKLKRVSALMTGFQDQYTQQGKDTFLTDWGMTAGEFQQKLGTDAVRDGLHQDAWVIALFADYKPYDNWIITDVRFHNESEAILQRGGIMVRIDGTRIVTQRNRNHISEIALDDWELWHYRFDNTHTTIEQLQQHAKEVITFARILNAPTLVTYAGVAQE